MKYFLLILFSFNVFAQSPLDLETIDEYFKIEKEYYQKVCSYKTEEKHSELLKQYHGDGNYIPTLLDEKIDLKTIKSLIPLIDEKIVWIESQVEFLKTQKDFKDQKTVVANFKKISHDLLEAKRDFHLSEDESKKKQIETENTFIKKNLLIGLEALKTKMPFMLSFKFPVNHLNLRADYEKVKDSSDKEGRSKANQIFFTRKIIQDGAFDEDTMKSDAMLRATFDTLYISLKNASTNNDFITENDRVDLHYILKNFENLLKSKPAKMERRYVNWLNRMKRTRDFYQNLIDNKKFKISEDSQLQDITSMLENRSRALYNLKDFSLTKQAEAYNFWASKSELFQSLFTLETILYSEVGRTDENVGFFRQDVAQVVINRSTEPRFNQFGANDQIVKYLPKELKTKDLPWLNVLFKEGEFSFTYFYIPGNLQIFCPDQSRIGKYLRHENLKIAINLLNNPRKEFKGIRYFSRVSMFGRISMDSIWKDYAPVGEDPGNEIKKNLKKLKDFYTKGHYRYLYDFAGSDSKNYRVIEIKGNHYVVSNSDENKFYTYRNPNLFKFFSFVK